MPLSKDTSTILRYKKVVELAFDWEPTLLMGYEEYGGGVRNCKTVALFNL